MMKEVSLPYAEGDRYMALDTLFCDGLEICVGGYPSVMAETTKYELMNNINCATSAQTVKNL